MSGMGLPPPPGTPPASGPWTGTPPQHEQATPARQRGPVAVRPLNLGEVLDGAFKLLRADWRTLVLISAVFLVPVQLAAAYVQRDLFGGGMLEMFTDPTAGELFMDGSAGADAAMLIGLLNGVLVTPLVTGAVAAAVATTYLGGRSSVGSALRTALGRSWALVASWVLVVLAATLPFLVAFGVIAGGAAVESIPLIVVGVLLVLLAIVVSLAIPALFAATVPAVVVERLGPLQGMGRSAHLLRPRLWAVLGTLLVAGLMILMLSMALGAVPQFLGLMAGERFGWIMVAGGSIVAGLVTTPLLAIVLILLYFDGRVRREGLDLRMAADDLGWSGHGGPPVG